MQPIYILLLLFIAGAILITLTNKLINKNGKH